MRKKDLSFSRPLSEASIIAQIESGEITAQDEICPGKGYWFSIQELNEVKAHFGNIQLKAHSSDGEEITSTSVMQTLSDQTGVSYQKRDFSNEGQQPKPQLKLVPPIEQNNAHVYVGIVLALIFLGTLVMLWLGSR